MCYNSLQKKGGASACFDHCTCLKQQFFEMPSRSASQPIISSSLAEPIYMIMAMQRKWEDQSATMPIAGKDPAAVFLRLNSSLVTPSQFVSFQQSDSFLSFHFQCSIYGEANKKILEKCVLVFSFVCMHKYTQVHTKSSIFILFLYKSLR